MKWMCFLAVTCSIVFQLKGAKEIIFVQQEIEDLADYFTEVDRLFESMKVLQKADTAASSTVHNIRKRPRGKIANNGGRNSFDRFSDSDESPFSLTVKEPSVSSTYGKSSSSTISEESAEGNRDYSRDESESSEEILSFTQLVDPVDTSNNTDCLNNVDHVSTMFKDCIYTQSSLSNYNQQDSSTHDVNAHFLKYCRRAPEIRTCFKHYLLNELKNCTDEGFRETINNIEVVVTSIIRFICRNEADRISLFIADGGVRCLKWNKGKIALCLAKNLGNLFIESVFDLPSQKIDADKCDDLKSAQVCVGRQLNTCEDKTSAKVLVLLFNIVQEIATCDSASKLNNYRIQSTTNLTTTKPPLSLGINQKGYETTQNVNVVVRDNVRDNNDTTLSDGDVSSQMNGLQEFFSYVDENGKMRYKVEGDSYSQSEDQNTTNIEEPMQTTTEELKNTTIKEQHIPYTTTPNSSASYSVVMRTLIFTYILTLFL